MAAKRILLCLHLGSVVVAYGLLALGWALLPNSTSVDAHRAAVVSAISLLSVLGAATGLASMALRSGKSERVGLAVSTVAAVLLALFHEGA